MHLSASRFWALAATFLLVNVLGIIWIRASLLTQHQPLLRVVSVTPSPEQSLDDADRVRLTFHEPIAREDQLHVALDTAPFSITPQIEGHWEWTAIDALEFIPAARFPSGREFTVAATPDAARLTGRATFGTTQFRLRTSPIALLETKLLSVEPGEAATLELAFNQPVLPADLAKHLIVQVDKKDVAFKCLGNDAAATVAVRIEQASDTIDLEITPELTGFGADLPLEAKITKSLKIPSLTRLDVLRAEVSQGTFDPEATIRFITTLPLDAAQPRPAVELEPSVEGVRVVVSEREVRLEGPFVCGVRYAATLPGTLVSKDGKTLGAPRRLEFVVSDRASDIRFPFSSGMLSPSGNMLLDADLVNLSNVSLQVSKVYSNNLLAHLDGNDLSSTSREFPAKTIKVVGARNTVQKVALDLAACLGKAKGIYRITLSSEDSRWTRDTAIVALSDLAISAKSGRDGILVWVTSVATGKPVAGAKLQVLSDSNQMLAQATSDASGVAQLAIVHDHPDGTARVVVAEVADDTGFLELGGATDLLDRVDQSGRATPYGYDIYLYTERGIYQPGEPVHLTGIVRDGGDGSTPAPFPLEVAVVRPDGREVAHLAARADENGLFHVQYDSVSSGHRGRYRFITRLPGATEVLGQASALIEEFVPPRIEVKAQAQTTEAGLKVELGADYLFGMPAAGLVADIEARYVLSRFEHPAFAGFTFDLPPDIAFVPVIQERAKEVSSELGADGKTSATVPGPTSKGYWKAAVTSSVHETGGRTVSAMSSAIIDTQPLHVGLRLKDAASSVAPFGVEWVLVDPKGVAAVGREVAFRLVRVETDWTLEEVRGRLTWRSTQRETEVRSWNAAASTAAMGSERLSCDSGGAYRLYAKVGTDAAAMLEMDVPWGQGEKARSQRPERVAVTLDHDDYEPGQVARATIISPFAGQMLVTIETDRVLWSMVGAVQAGANLIDVPLPVALRGGAFLSVSVVRPIDVSSERWLPVSARGLARITTRHPAQRLEATLEVSSSGLPTSTQSVVLHTPAGLTGLAHVWAVDDGILLATAFKKPDPFAWFLAHRALAVETEDAYRELLPDYKRPAEFTRIGGDGDSEDGVRGPTPRRVTLDGVLWNKAIALDPSGTTRITMQMPDLTGRLRFIAVVVAGDRYQSIEQTLTLASPLMIEASLPLFIAPGDRLEVPVRVINSTRAPMRLSLSQQVVTGPVLLSGAAMQELEVGPMTSSLVWRTLTCSDEGSATLMFEARTSDAAAMARARGEVTCRAAAGLVSIASVQAIKTGEVSTITLDPALDPAQTKVQVRIEPNPTVHLGPAVDALVDYPHGCLEQTSSRLLALLEAGRASRGRDPSRAETIDAMIDAGIHRLRSMQTAAGGLSYWPDSQNPDVWGTVYAAEVLVRARAAGRPVDARFMSEVTDYLAGRLGATRGEAAAIDDSTRAHLCDVLAQLGKPQPGWVATLRERASSLDIAGRAHVASALHAAGKVEQARAVLTPDTLSMNIPTSSKGTLTSQTAQLATLLEVLLRVDPANPWVPALAQRVDAARQNGAWGSTLENAAALTALAAYHRAHSAASSYRGVVHAPAGSLPCTSKEPFETRLAGSALPLRIELASDAADGAVQQAFATITMRGVTKQAPEPVDRGLRVRRTWQTRDGREVDPLSIRVGDLILVQVSLDAPGRAIACENIAIVDLLPSGFEVENPSLATSAVTAKERATPDRIEFLHDRVVIFTNAYEQVRTYAYYIRATSAGQSLRPSIQATSMYEAGLGSVHGEEITLQVKP